MYHERNVWSLSAQIKTSRIAFARKKETVSLVDVEGARICHTRCHTRYNSSSEPTGMPAGQAEISIDIFHALSPKLKLSTEIRRVCAV